MKKLLFALTPAQQIANGSSIYTEFVFKKVLETGKPFEAYYNPNIETNKSIIKRIPQHIELHKCSDITELEKLLTSKSYDTVFFGNETNTEAKLPKNTTPIVVIHDLRFIEVPNDATRYLYRITAFERFKQIIASTIFPNYDSDYQKKRISNFIDHPKLKIVTVSNHTKYSILLNFPKLKDSQIYILSSPYPEIGVQNTIPNEKQILKELRLVSKEYFLIISAGRWFKNSYRAIQALDHLADRKLLKNKKVLVLGVQGSNKITQVKNPETFIFRDYVENETLQCAYANAFGFIYPSLQEGFGIPPLEAMQYGTPVLAASTSAINEVCRTGACYFNPYSVMEMENRILHLLNDKIFYEKLSAAGVERSKEIALKQKDDLNELLKLIFE